MAQTPSVDRRSSTSSLHLDYSIIYEVNLSVPKHISDEYLSYLKSFTRQVCVDVEGFTNALIYSQPKPGMQNPYSLISFILNPLGLLVEGLHWLSEEGIEKSYFTVHYHIDSQRNLETYLEKYQEHVANANQDRFKFLVTSRRILRLQMSTFDD